MLYYQINNFIVRLFLFFLIAEIAAYYNDLTNLIGTSNFSILNVKGFAGNKNITAASIAFKLPFLLFLIYTSKKQLYRLLYIVLLTFGVLAIYLIEARAAILSTLLVIFSFILYQFITIVLQTVSLKKGFLNLFYTTVPYVLAFTVNLIISKNIQRGSITETVGEIAFTEESSNGRFQYWGDAFDYVIKNPIFGSGLGNWKIASISEGKEHINGYTVPYHAHNDFIHVFTETGIPGGIAYAGIFVILAIYLVVLLFNKFKTKGTLDIKYFFLLLPFIVYGIDAGLNFPVARPLMQSSLALFCGLILVLYLDSFQINKSLKAVSVQRQRILLGLILTILLPGLAVHVISYISLTKQGLLLYEFNNAKYNLTRAQLDEISHDFPNLTETAMPIKAMKARYYYLQGNREEAFEMIEQGAKDNPQIYFSENLKAQFFFNESKIDSAYIYAKKAFDGLPNNMPHYDMYMKTLVAKKEVSAIDEAFNLVRSLGGDTSTIWTIYIRSLAQTRSLRIPMPWKKQQKHINCFPMMRLYFHSIEF